MRHINWQTLEILALPLQNECRGNNICKLLQSKCTLQEGTEFCRKVGCQSGKNYQKRERFQTPQAMRNHFIYETIIMYYKENRHSKKVKWT